MLTKRRVKGFSLIEIIVVITIIGIFFSIVGVGINNGGGPERDVNDSLERFMTVSGFASERAILSGETMGLRLIPPGWQAEDFEDYQDLGWQYEWVALTQGGWRALPNAPKISFPNTVDLIIDIGGIDWEWEEVLDRETPLTAYYPSGDISPIKLEFTDSRDEEYTQTIEVDETGELVWVELKEQLEEEASRR